MKSVLFPRLLWLLPALAPMLVSANTAATTPQPAAQTQTTSKKSAIAAFTKGMQHQRGYFDFYYDAKTDKVYLQVDKLAQPFIFQSSLPRGVGSNDIGLD
ncbi:MAG TPA: hypothetical protein VGE17_02850, partial [Methylophilus sp.]